MDGEIASPRMVQEPEMKEPERKEAPQIVMDGVITPSEVPLRAKVPLLDHGALKELGLSSGEWGNSLVVVGEEGKNAAWGLFTALTSHLGQRTASLQAKRSCNSLFVQSCASLAS